MLARIRKSMEEKDQGFTLIELLVVIIIIGILAAIAIPVFLNQRKKGWDAQTKSDIRNLATLQETYLTENTTSYAASAAALTDFQQSPNVASVTVKVDGANGFCIVGVSDSGNAFLYDSDNGGLQNSPYADAATAQGACTVGGSGTFV